MKTALANFAKSFLINLKTIIFALVVSVIVWFAISFKIFPNVTRTIEVPLSTDVTEYMRDVNLELADEINETINVNIEGKRYDTAGLTADDFNVYLDFSEIKEPGDYDVAVLINAWNEANSQFLVQGKGIKKKVRIIQTAEKTLSVTPYVEHIEVTEGMSIEHAAISVNPESISFSGEKSLIDAVHSVRISAVSEQTLSATATLPGELTFFDSKGNQLSNDGINVEDRAFTITVPIYKRKTLQLKVTIINAPENFDLDSLYDKMRIEPKELTIAAPDASIDNHSDWTLGPISLSDITFGNLESGIPIQIELPEGYSNVSGDRMARVVFDDIDGDYGVMFFDVPMSNFSIINPPPGYDIEYITRVVRVKVVGPSSVIRSMSSSDINGTINLGGLTDISVGERSIGMKFTLSGTNVHAWVVDEYKVDIEISKS